MAKNKEVTGKKAASAASKVLRDPKSSKAAKSAAASKQDYDEPWAGVAAL